MTSVMNSFHQAFSSQIHFFKENCKQSMLANDNQKIAKIALIIFGLLAMSLLLLISYRYKKPITSGHLDDNKKMNITIPKHESSIVEIDPEKRQTGKDSIKPLSSKDIVSRENTISLVEEIYNLSMEDNLEKIPSLLKQFFESSSDDFSSVKTYVKKLWLYKKFNAIEIIFKNGIECKPQSKFFQMQYFDLLRDQKRFEDAEKVYNEYFFNDEMIGAGMLSHYGEVLSSLGKHKEAELVFKKASIKLKEDNYCVYMHSAEHFKNQGKYKEAENLLEDYQNLVPERFVDEYVHILLKQNKHTKIKEYMKIYLEDFPKGVESITAFIGHLCDKKFSYEIILPYIEIVFKHDPNNINALRYFERIKQVKATKMNPNRSDQSD